MLDLMRWIKGRRPVAQAWREPDEDTPKPQERVMTGQYLLLYKYLKNRYAGTVVLTFGEIEDLLGFALPDQARLQKQWWTNPEVGVAGSNYSDSWILASRSAVPNLSARTVVFEHGG